MSDYTDDRAPCQDAQHVRAVTRGDVAGSYSRTCRSPRHSRAMSHVTTHIQTRTSATSNGRFFAIMAALAAIVVLAGFGPSYYFWPVTQAIRHAGGQAIPASLPWSVHPHAVFSSWVALLVIQSSLVAAGRAGLHRRLGMTAVVMIPPMCLLGLTAAVGGARRGWTPGGPYPDALGFMAVGVKDIAVFTTLAVAGLLYRRRPDPHKRLMLYATFGGLMWPAITRAPGVAGNVGLMFGTLAVLLLAPVTRDFLHRDRHRWLSAALAIGVFATFPLRAALGNSAAWRQFAGWMVGL